MHKVCVFVYLTTVFRVVQCHYYTTGLGPNIASSSLNNDAARYSNIFCWVTFHAVQFIEDEYPSFLLKLLIMCIRQD